VADRLADGHGGRGVGDQLAAAGKNVVDHDVGTQPDGLVVGDHLIGADHRTVRGVVLEGRDHADESAVLVGDRPAASTVPGGESDPRNRVDVTKGADIAVLVNLHPRGHHDTGIGLCHRSHRRAQRCGRNRSQCVPKS
jgi:hypothetical protein